MRMTPAGCATGLDMSVGISQYRNQVQQRFGIEIGRTRGINYRMVVVGQSLDLRME